MTKHDINNSSIIRGELLLFRTLWQNTTDNMFIVRLNEEGDFISESCNRSLEKTFHLEPHQVDGVSLRDILDIKAYKLISKRYKECISLNKPITYNESVILDNHKRYFNTTILPVIDEEVRIFGISRETTELINKEQEKLALEQTKNKQIKEIIENISHQWRQPLTVISLSASSLKINKELGIDDDKQEEEVLSTIIESIHYLSHTIDILRNTIEEENEYKEGILQDNINSAVEKIKASLENSNIDLIENINSIEPIKITTFAGELSEVIVKIINNSKDALLKNKIDKPFVKVNLEKKDNHVIISIEDNGGGISSDILPKIFDLYFTTKHKSQGTGLGLYLCKNIIEEHLNGDLSVLNTKNGVIFKIKLPLHQN